MTDKKIEEHLRQSVRSVFKEGEGVWLFKFNDGRVIRAGDEEARLMVRGTSFEKGLLDISPAADIVIRPLSPGDLQRQRIYVQFKKSRELRFYFVNRNADVCAEPPRAAEFILAAILKGKAGEALIGDLCEHFNRNVSRYGVRRAKRIYWAQVLRSVGPITARFFWKAIKIGLLAEIWRRWRG